MLILIVINHRHWLPWISERFVRERDRDRIEVHEIAAPDALPDDVASAVRGLLAKGRTRAALALLYRASVVRLADALGTPLPPGATESECLRQARRLAEPSYAALFPRIVRCWQSAAYAQRVPQTKRGRGTAGRLERARAGAGMNRRAWGIGALVLLACIAVGAWWSYTFEHVEDDIDSPLHGEALYNPLYALKKVLQARGIDAVSRANLNLQAMSPEW